MLRYFIIRRRVRIALLFILLAVFTVALLPWIYENIFVREEDFIAQKKVFLDFPNFLTESEIDKSISLDTTFFNNGYTFSEFRINELELKDMIISAEVVVKGKLVKDKEGSHIGFSGKILSKNITLNSEPFLPLRMSFDIKDNELDIKALSLGKSYKLGGKVMLTGPFKTDLRLDIIRLDMRGANSSSRIKGRNVMFGIVNGTIYIKGDLGGNIFSQGSIESRNGTVGSIGYDVVTVRLEGFGPIINIVDSSVKQDSGKLTIEGYVDLRNIAKGNLFDGLRVKSDMKTIAWDGWAITKKGTDQLSMKKDVSDNMQVGFKTISRQPLTTYDDTQNPEEMSLEYKMGLQNLKMKLKENEEFFGIEQSVRF
jgi:hypothetical protein